MRPAAFYIAEAARLRGLAADCTIEVLGRELLARAAELEELARWARDGDFLTRDREPVVDQRFLG